MSPAMGSARKFGIMAEESGDDAQPDVAEEVNMDTSDAKRAELG